MRKLFIILEEKKLIFYYKISNNNLIFNIDKINKSLIKELNLFLSENNFYNFSSILFVHECYDLNLYFSNYVNLLNNFFLIEQNSILSKIFSSLKNNSIIIENIFPLQLIRKNNIEANNIFVSINNNNTILTSYNKESNKISYFKFNLSLNDYFIELSNKLEVSYDSAKQLIFYFIKNENNLRKEEIVFNINNLKNKISFQVLKSVISLLNNKFINLILKTAEIEFSKNINLYFEYDLLKKIPINFIDKNSKLTYEKKLLFFQNEYYDYNGILNTFCIVSKKNEKLDYFKKSISSYISSFFEKTHDITNKFSIFER